MARERSQLTRCERSLLFAHTFYEAHTLKGTARTAKLSSLSHLEQIHTIGLFEINYTSLSPAGESSRLQSGRN